MYVDGAGAGTGIGIYNTPATESSPDVVIAGARLRHRDRLPRAACSSARAVRSRRQLVDCRILAAIHQCVDAVADFWTRLSARTPDLADVFLVRTRIRLRASFCTSPIPAITACWFLTIRSRRTRRLPVRNRPRPGRQRHPPRRRSATPTATKPHRDGHHDSVPLRPALLHRPDPVISRSARKS